MTLKIVMINGQYNYRYDILLILDKNLRMRNSSLTMKIHAKTLKHYMQCLKRLSLRLRVSEEHKIGSIKGNAHQQQLLYTPTATMYGCCMGGDSWAFIIAQRQLQNYQKIKQLRLS